MFLSQHACVKDASIRRFCGPRHVPFCASHFSQLEAAQQVPSEASLAWDPAGPGHRGLSVRAAACCLPDNALSHEGIHTNMLTFASIGVASFLRAEWGLFSLRIWAAAGCQLINTKLGIYCDQLCKLKCTNYRGRAAVIKQSPEVCRIQDSGFRTATCAPGPHRTFLLCVNQGQCLCSLCFPGRGSRFSQLLQYWDTPRISPR